MAKKWLLLALAACMLLGMLSGCAAPADNSTGSIDLGGITGNGSNNQTAQVDPADFTKTFSFEGLTLTATAEYEKTQETPSMIEIETENVSIDVYHYDAANLTVSLKEMAQQNYEDTKNGYASLGLSSNIQYTEGNELCYYTVSFETASNGICVAFYQVGEDIIQVRAIYSDAAAYGAEAQYIALNGQVG